MKTQIERILTGLVALVAAGITAQAQDNQTGFDGPPLNPASADRLPPVHYTWTTLDAPLAIHSAGVGFGTFAVGIFGNSIVGGYADSVGNAHGFLYDEKKETWTTLDAPLAGTASGQGTFVQYSWAGQIAGWYVDNAGLEHGFIATPSFGPQ